MSRTLEQKHGTDGIVKAGELIEIRHSAPLTLHDRRVLNLLIEAAGPGIADDIDHKLSMSVLRSSHKGGERVKDSILRLMQTIVEVPVRDSKGNASTKHMALLSDTTTTDDENNPTGEVTYSFSKGMRSVLKQSRYWGRIKGIVMFAFTSKYSLSLYELVCLRGNLRKNTETFLYNDLRELLGVPEGKLERTPDLLRRVIYPAVEEVNALSDFKVELELIRVGGFERGKLHGFKIIWERKDGDDWRATLGELGQPKVGRRARIQGKVEDVISVGQLGVPGFSVRLR